MALAEQAFEGTGQWVEGIRRIVGSRIEISMDGKWWQETIEASWPGFTEALKQFTQNQAGKDCRLRDKSEMIFSNWSLIINYSKVLAQIFHIDANKRNHQFGLLLSPGPAPATDVADPSSLHRLDTPDKLIKHWKLEEGFATTSLRKKEVVELIANFGDLLVPRGDLAVQMDRGKEHLQTLDLISTPGGVVHAGPNSDSFRAVLFCSACPRGEIAYDQEDQMTPHGVICYIINILWESMKPSMKPRGRRMNSERLRLKKFLFTKLAEVVVDYMPHETSSTFQQNGPYEKFIEFIEECCVDGKFPVEKRPAYISALVNKVGQCGKYTTQLPDTIRCAEWLKQSISQSSPSGL